MRRTRRTAGTRRAKVPARWPVLAMVVAAVLVVAAAAVVAWSAGGSGAGASRAAAPGVAGAVAECRGTAAPAASGRQLRGLWIATVDGTDWPEAGASAAAQRAAYTRLLDSAVAMRMNAVFVQVRPAADAFYASPYEPWSRYLTGTAGRDPGWDVLGFLVAEAHRRGLEFHAWFNPYRVSLDTDRSKLAASSPARAHPDWVVSYGGQLWYDPGLPQVRELAVNAVLDVERRYDIDGVHLDDYFYPYPAGGSFPDSASFKAYGGGLGLAAWRRRNVDVLVRELSQRVHAAKAWVQFGISPFGVWRNSSSDPAGSRTSALQSYDDIYADTRGWVRGGWLDYVAPQLYWPIGDPRADYETLVRWWSSVTAGTRVGLWIGQAGYRVGEDAVWRRPAELSRHLAVDDRYPQVTGEVFFSATDVARNRGGWAAKVRADHFRGPVLPPASAAAVAPASPSALRVSPGAPGVALSWRGVPDARGYAVYRVEGAVAGCRTPAPGSLLTTVPAAGTAVSVTDRSAAAGRAYTYVVTALGRGYGESGPAKGVPVTVPRG